MLWKEESHRPDAFYIDILTPNACIETRQSKKSDAIEIEMRNERNFRFRESSLIKAMELFNESMCIDRSGSEHISLAYTVRTAFFLRLKRC